MGIRNKENVWSIYSGRLRVKIIDNFYTILVSVDQKQLDRAENFLEKYYNDGYIKNFQKNEELSYKDPNGRNKLAELGKAINNYENSKLCISYRNY
jgi:hypothetical protein